MMYYLMYVGNFSNKNKTPDNLKSLTSYKDNFFKAKNMFWFNKVYFTYVQ